MYQFECLFVFLKVELLNNILLLLKQTPNTGTLKVPPETFLGPFQSRKIGPSGVLALPFAAGINLGGHYFS